MTVDALYSDLDPMRPLGWDPRDFVDQVIAADWVCAQLTTYDLGGLDAFLTERASPALTAASVGADGWPLATMSGYRLVDVQDDQLVAVDLLTSRTVRLLNVGAAWERDVNTCVIGRLAPTGAEPGLMFESRPLTVDDTTALQVARAAGLGRTTWLNVLAEARAAGRLEVGFSLCLPTSLVCDLPGGPPTGMAGEGDPAVVLCDLVLDEVTRGTGRGRVHGTASLRRTDRTGVLGGDPGGVHPGFAAAGVAGPGCRLLCALRRAVCGAR